jgi:hypothetical protein
VLVTTIGSVTVVFVVIPVGVICAVIVSVSIVGVIYVVVVDHPMLMIVTMTVIRNRNFGVVRTSSCSYSVSGSSSSQKLVVQVR